MIYQISNGNNYTFDLLKKEEIPPEINDELICLKMWHTVSGELLLMVDYTDGLTNLLHDGIHYLAHNLIYRKGKDIIFKGKLVIATKENIISFIKRSIDCDDLRSLLISPVFERQPEYVVHVDEDGVFIKYADQR